LNKIRQMHEIAWDMPHTHPSQKFNAIRTCEMN
jgi:hypothetical protein